MTTLIINTGVPSADGKTFPLGSTITCTPTKEFTHEGALILPKPVIALLDATNNQIDLLHTGAGWNWHINITMRNVAVWENTYAIPNTTNPINLTSLTPLYGSPTPQWQTQLDQLIQLGGVRGDQGPEGRTGPMGPEGKRGFNGIQGNTGPQGPTGTQGLPGTNGTNGLNGANVLPTNTAILQGLQTDPAIQNELSATIGESVAPLARKVPHGPRTVFDGDSITIGSIDGALQNRAASWTNVTARASDGRMSYLHNAAVSGQTSSAALSRFDNHVAPQSPDTVILTIGTNDVGQGLTLETYQANIQAYRDKVKAIGAKLIVGQIWPTDDDTNGRKATTAAWSEWLAQWAATEGVHLIPWQDLADPATNGWPAGWSSDGIHPNNPSDAATKIGTFGWEQIKAVYGESVIPRAVMNNQGLTTNGFFESTTGGVAVTAALTATPNATAGTLPAGLYAYRIAARTHYGEGVASPPVATQLTATGQVVLTWSGTSGNKGFHLYRRGPLDMDYRRIMTWDTGVTSYTDDGTATTGTKQPLAVDASAYPVGYAPGFNKHYAEGFGGRKVTGVRGIVWRFTGMQDNTNSAGHYEIAGLAAGDIVTVKGRVAGSGVGIINWRWRSTASANLTVIRLVGDELTSEFGMFSHTMTAPASTGSGRLYFEGPAGGHIDVAELLITKV